MPGLRRAVDAHYEVVDGKALVIDPAGAELVTLNRLGTLVWQALDGQRDAEELAAELAGQVPGVERSQLEGDVRAFIAELERLGLTAG
jgi:hypothetical protein